MTQNEPAEAAARPPVREGPGAVPGPGTTGDPQVDAALDKLADLAELPLNEHPAVFEQIHGALAGALGTVDPTTVDSTTGYSTTGYSTTGDSTTGNSTTGNSTTGGPGSGAGHPGSGGPGY